MGPNPYNLESGWESDRERGGEKKKKLKKNGQRENACLARILTEKRIENMNKESGR